MEYASGQTKKSFDYRKMEAINSNQIFLSISLGLLPPILWLWFWLKQDSKRPEPRKVIILTFMAGMGAVLIALPLELGISYIMERISVPTAIVATSATLFLWALIEESLKYLSARLAALRRACFDEPIDAIIYLITAALGFAALENIFFLLKIYYNEGMMAGIITGNLRFVGSTLLHTATSAIVGSSIAFSFYPPKRRLPNLIASLILVSVLHFIFNFFIIKSEGMGVLKIFIPLWLVIIFIIFIFEKVKLIRQKKQ